MNVAEEIADTEQLIAQQRASVLDHLATAADRATLDAKVLSHYKNFIDACFSRATSILATCRAIAAMSDVPPHAAKQVIDLLLIGAHETTTAMFLGMLAIEQVAVGAAHLVVPVPAVPDAGPPTRDASSQHTPAPVNDTQPTCSFCGKTATETPVVAAPAGGICAACTRLAAAIHGIAIAD